MEPMTARGLLAMQLSPEQKEKLKKYERTLPAGRCLTAFEICQWLRLKPAPAAEADTTLLDGLRKEYDRRILWKLNKLEEKSHVEHCLKRCFCRSRQDEVREWEDWVAENFGKAMEEIEWGIPVRKLTEVSKK